MKKYFHHHLPCQVILLELSASHKQWQHPQGIFLFICKGNIMFHHLWHFSGQSQNHFQLQWWVCKRYSYDCHISCMSWQLQCIFRSVLKMVETTNWHIIAQTFQQLATVEPAMPIHFRHRHSLSSCPICNVSVANFWQNIIVAHCSKPSLSSHQTFMQCALLRNLLLPSV
jgi:hypothetical protein